MPKPDTQRLVQELLDESLYNRMPSRLPEAPGPEMRADERSELRRWLDSFASEQADPLGLTRRGDWMPGVAQALAAKDYAELGQARESLPEDAPWYADPLLVGAQGLSAAAMIPLIGGLVGKPRRAALDFAEDIIERTRAEGGVTVNPRTGYEPETGVSVGGRVPGTELSAPVGATTPEQLVQHLEQAPVDLRREDWANIGGWLDEGQEFFDISEVLQGPSARHRATVEAARRGELASWDIGAGKEIRTPPGDVLEGLHYAHQPLETVDPQFAGTNRSIRGAEAARRGPPYNALPHSFFGSAREQMGVNPYARERRTGIHVHGAELPGIMNPATASPEVREQLEEQLVERTGGALDHYLRASEYERLLQEMGYYGMVNPQSGIIQVGRQTPVDYLGALPPSLRGPQGRVLSLFGDEGGVRLEDLPETPLRTRRFARQRQVEEDLFGRPAEQPTFRPRPVRAKRRKQTVADPERMAYPDIYLPEQQIVDRARAGWTPESPYLRNVFDVSRQDVYEGFREAEKRGGGYRHGIPTKPGPAGYVSRIITPENTLRMKNILGLSSEDPNLLHSYGWYWTDPMFHDYVNLLGPDRGLQEYLRLHQTGAALSPRTEVPKETQRASIFDIQRRQGDPSAFLARDLPEGAGHYAARTHEPALRRMLEFGRFATTDPLQAAKSDPYFGARTGMNFDTAVMDAHLAAQSGLVDVRPAGKTPPTGSIRGYEGHLFNPWFGRRVAHPLGKRAVGSQAQLWNVMGPTTGVESDLGAPLLETFANLAAYKGLQTGRTPREAWESFVLGESGLYEPGYTDWAKELYRR